MSRIPDFTKVALDEGVRPLALTAAVQDASGSARGLTPDWLTPEGIAVTRSYTAADPAGLDFLDG